MDGVRLRQFCKCVIEREFAGSTCAKTVRFAHSDFSLVTHAFGHKFRRRGTWLEKGHLGRRYGRLDRARIGALRAVRCNRRRHIVVRLTRLNRGVNVSCPRYRRCIQWGGKWTAGRGRPVNVVGYVRRGTRCPAQVRRVRIVDNTGLTVVGIEDALDRDHGAGARSFDTRRARGGAKRHIDRKRYVRSVNDSVFVQIARACLSPRRR